MVRNTHERLINAPAKRAGALLDRLSATDDPIWPAPAWPPMRLDRPLGVGATGGHAGIRYTVEEYEPGARIRFRFCAPRSGYHELSIHPLDDERCLARHDMLIGTPGADLLRWPLVVRHLHDTIVEEVLDNLQHGAGDRVARPARHSRWVRLLHGLRWLRPCKVDPPTDSRLLPGALRRVDFADAFQVPLHPAMPSGPELWLQEFLQPPAVVRGLLMARNALVGPLGIRPASGHDAFAVVARDEDRELMVGSDEEHLDFRISVLTDDGHVTFTTLVTLHNRRGRLYWAVVRHFHPAVVRAIARRAHRQIALRSTPTARPGAV
ncbi:DUF2867 domain-containing protein [Streptomyces sp. NPDC004976]